MRPIVHTQERTIGTENRINPLDRHVVVDLETTGLSPRHGHRVIEIGAVAVENGAIMEEFSTLIDAGVPIPPHVQAIHGITDEMLEGKRRQRPCRPQRRLRCPLPPP
jgi:DNA polymerase III epsilon subunit-like protein